VLGQVLTPVPAWPTCFGRQVTAIVPPGGADFNGSSDPAVVDVILGTSGEDRIFGLEGNDFICGGGAFDYIEAGPGSDWVDGEQDTDIIYGGTGGDVLYGGAGGDVLLGDEGSDILFGQREDDSLACDPNPAVATGGTSDVADGGLGANDNIMVGDVGCESMTGVEYP
jgi:Ca2+-binding RTX toxin-like protein